MNLCVHWKDKWKEEWFKHGWRLGWKSVISAAREHREPFLIEGRKDRCVYLRVGWWFCEAAEGRYMEMKRWMNWKASALWREDSCTYCTLEPTALPLIPNLIDWWNDFIFASLSYIFVMCSLFLVTWLLGVIQQEPAFALFTKLLPDAVFTCIGFELQTGSEVPLQCSWHILTSGIIMLPWSREGRKGCWK